MDDNRYSFFKIFFICLISLSFFLGYYFRENAAGGGGEFYLISWPIIQSFKSDFWLTLQNYTTVKHPDYQLPFSHIINAYLNPFTDNIKSFQLSTTVISFGIYFVFAFVLKKIYSNINNFDILLTSSVLLLSPFFRTSAFWGKNENYGWLFFILALYFFFEIKKKLHSEQSNKDKLNVILFCFTSACALYARQALFFLPISYLLYLVVNKANRNILLTSIISFSILAIPGLITVLPLGLLENTTLVNPGLFSWLVKPDHIIKNIPILLSFFGFYLLPILIIELFHSDFKSFFKKYFINFIIALLFFVLLAQINLLEYLGNYKMSGGAVLKLNYLIAKNNYFLLLIFSSLGFSILIRLFREDIKNNLVILAPILVVYGFPEFLYQEYVEPLIILLFFLILKTNLHKLYFKNISLSNFIFLSYFAVYLAGSIYFKHFAFSTFEEWEIFLNAQ